MSVIRFNVGDVIQFGRYPQGYQGEVMPIEWRILDVREDRALILAQDMLDVQPFAGDDNTLFWGHCYLRNWLGDEFMRKAFTQEEMDQIYQPENPGYQVSDEILWQLFGTDDAIENVHDSVFVLSRADVLRYFPGTNSMFCPGAYAQPTEWVRGKYNADGLCWWLRSSSARSNKSYVVSPADSIGISWNVQVTRQGVRPALWLRMNS